MIRVQRIIVPDTQERCWVLFNADHPLIAPNQYLSYLHHLGRSPNTVRAYAHHLQAFSKFLSEENRDWTTLSLTELAKFVAWLRRISSSSGKSRSDTTINTILAAVGSFYEYQDRLGVETNISRSRRFGAKSPYKPFLHHISRSRPLQRAVMQVRATRRLPRVFSAQEVQALLNACARQRDRLLVSMLYESGMRIGQVLGLRHADVRSYDGEIDIIPRANSNGALAKSRSPYTVHVSKELMELYADYLVHEYQQSDSRLRFRELVGRSHRSTDDLPHGDRPVPQTQRQDWPARNAAHVPPHARDRSVAGRMGPSICSASSRARADPDHRQHLCASVERRSGENVCTLSKGACKVTKITWSRERQQSLLGQFSGFWKGDIWDMRASPLQTGLSAKTKQRRLHFGCKSATINSELKYACWKKFSDGDWRNTQELGRVHRMVKWLNSLGPLPASLMIRPFAEWRARYTTYLKERGMYRKGTTFRMDREQRPSRDFARQSLHQYSSAGLFHPGKRIR